MILNLYDCIYKYGRAGSIPFVRYLTIPELCSILDTCVASLKNC